MASWGRVNNGNENDDTSALGSILQYTSKPYDRDVMYRGFIYKKNTKPAKTSSPKPAAPAFNVEQAARDVIAGKYGVGDARKKALGSHYAAVQARVNQILGTKKTTKPKPAASSAIKVGDHVKVIKAVDYNGKSFKAWYSTYTVMELKGNRAVIGVNGTVTAAINVSNLRKA